MIKKWTTLVHLTLLEVSNDKDKKCHFIEPSYINDEYKKQARKTEQVAVEECWELGAQPNPCD